MPATILVLAAGPSPQSASRIPECLLPVAGDPSLLWVLRTLPQGGTALLLHTSPAVATAVEGWAKAGLLPCLPELFLREGATEADLVVAGRDLLASRGTPEALLLSGVMPLLQPEAWPAPTASPDLLHLPDGHVLANRADQAELEVLARIQLTSHWMEQGVSFTDPESVTLGPRVKLAPDVVIEGLVRLEGNTQVGEGSRIGQGCVIKDCDIASGVELRPYCVAQQAIVGPGCKVGPFAHLREGSVLDAEVHVGNFVETKKTHLRRGAKANHLSYLGDAEIGEKTNIGAGCITCNYDGVHKHRTIIGKGVFVGSDCQLVAPVTLGDGSLIAAGTTVTQDVPGDALALSRTPMVLREGAAERLRVKLKTILR